MSTADDMTADEKVARAERALTVMRSMEVLYMERVDAFTNMNELDVADDSRARRDAYRQAADELALALGLAR